MQKKLEALWQKCVAFHGHGCGGLALGIAERRERRYGFGRAACRDGDRRRRAGYREGYGVARDLVQDNNPHVNVGGLVLQQLGDRLPYLDGSIGDKVRFNHLLFPSQVLGKTAPDRLDRKSVV